MTQHEGDETGLKKKGGRRKTTVIWGALNVLGDGGRHA